MMVTFDICAGNPGALQFLMQAYDMDMFKAEQGFQRMQRAGITGARLYMLWNDCCNRDTEAALLARNGKIAIKGKEYPIKLTDGFYIIRKLTVTECKRLQTVPDTYTFPVSDTQAYKMLGNGWTVDVIAHIMSHFDGLTEEPVEVLSMYDGMSCGHIALDKLGVDVTAYYATEIDKYAIQTTQHNFPDTVQLGDAFQVRDEEWRPRRAEEAE